MGVEQILVVPRSELLATCPLQGFCPDPVRVSHFLDLVVAHGRFVPRWPAEEDEALKQIVPYGVVRHAGEFFLFRRGRQGQEAGLRGRWSVGLGGHVNPADSAAIGPAMLERALQRELEEEVTLDRPSMALWGVLNDDTDPVGRRHLGFVYRVEVGSPTAASREPGKIAGDFVSLSTVLAGREEMESWSRLTVDAWIAAGAAADSRTGVV